ncbi:MAG: BamA/TamA family outer membrane protein [Acidobacteriota bacterium]|nr:BamA/TamA family outer membrane protein [Acidobacteriota bacterium]
MATARREWTACAVALALAAGSIGAAAASPQALPAPEAAGSSCGTLAAIEVRGNERMSADAVRFDLGVKVGDAWDPLRIRREFVRFWKRGYFADLRFFRRCEPSGAVLVIELRERPSISSITYQKVKIATEQQIEDHFRERDFSLSIGTPLDRKKLWRAESLIKDLLGQKGYLDARVTAQVEEVSARTASVHFRILPGNKTRIRKLEFTGNERFSDRRLGKQLELTREWRWWWPFGKKSLYHPLKYQQDINNVLKYYRDRGYLDVDVKPPVVDIETKRGKKAEEKAQKKLEQGLRRAEKKRQKELQKAEDDLELVVGQKAAPVEVPELAIKERKWVYLKVPVVEGPVFRLGSLSFEGNTLFEDSALRPLIPIRDGAVLSDAVLEFGLELIRNLYGDRGYIYAVASRRFERDESGEPVADVVVTVDEDQAYTIGRIEFSGNMTTQDVVLRRELNVFEGEVISRRQLDRSMLKLRQLGFWLPNDEPSLDPEIDSATVNVTIAGEEQSRNEVNLGGGFSELEGGFFFGSYSTANFLGRGETLSVQASVGGRSNRASISFLERWFLGRPVTFGFRIFRTTIDFGRTFDASGNLNRLSRSGSGASLTLGKRIGDFTLIQATYSYEETESDSQAPLVDPASGLVSTEFTRIDTKLASITPLFSYSKLNNPLRPTKGLSLSVVPQVTAEAFGGEQDFIRPRIEASLYQPLGKRLFVALHGELGWIRPFGGDTTREAGFIDGVPLFQRFFIGGDTLGPRVFETRSLSPIRSLVQTDAFGNAIVDPATGLPFSVQAFVGGSKMALLQTELGMPIGRTATIAGFVDIGGVYDNGVNINYDDARVSAGVEFRVFLPVFQAPIRLIYGWPIQEEPADRSSSFQFSIGLPF